MQTFRRKIVTRSSIWGTIGVPKEVMSAWNDAGYDEVELQWSESEPALLKVIGSASSGDDN